MTHEERVYHHLYETLEGIAEQSERIASLEELVLDMYGRLQAAGEATGMGWMDARMAERMRALGLDPEGEK